MIKTPFLFSEDIDRYIMSSMSTPVHQLPPNAPTSAKLEDDPTVATVIQELEKELHQAPPSPPVHHVQTTVPSNIPMPPSMMMPPPSSMPTLPVATEKSWFDTDSAKRAVLCAVLAFVLFYPNLTSGVYEKITFLARFESYDLFLRMFLLAAVLYVLLWRGFI